MIILQRTMHTGIGLVRSDHHAIPVDQWSKGDIILELQSRMIEKMNANSYFRLSH
ncbi:MAG: hypothetical protein AMXMBFR84_48640 [Candidatus Hydrogenedentota bacterium]